MYENNSLVNTVEKSCACGGVLGIMGSMLSAVRCFFCGGSFCTTKYIKITCLIVTKSNCNFSPGLSLLTPAVAAAALAFK